MAVRYWYEETVDEVVSSLQQYFNDIQITQSYNGELRTIHLPMIHLLLGTTKKSRFKDISPTMHRDLLHAALDSRIRFPREAYANALRHTIDDKFVRESRLAIIKAYINRSCRLNDPSNKEDLKMALDPNNINIGYRLGRLLAVMHKIQQTAIPGVDGDLVQKHWAHALRVPVDAFKIMFINHQHHVHKVLRKKPGLGVYFDKMRLEVLGEIKEFPARLSAMDQGRFIVGYAHQMAHMYLSKEQKEALEKQNGGETTDGETPEAEGAVA